MIQLKDISAKTICRRAEMGLPYFTVRGWLVIFACSALGGIAGGLAYSAMMAPFMAK